MTLSDNRTAATLWIVLLAVASIVTTLALACATPFTALAAIAATQLRRRDGIALMAIAWASGQAIGFCTHGYPHDPVNIMWAVALAMGAVIALLAARAADARAGRHGGIARIALAYVVASVAFKLVILIWSFGLGGVGTALSLDVMARQLARNGAILIGLMILYRGLLMAGLPAAPRGAAVPA